MDFTGERFVPNIESADIELAVEHYHRYLTILPFVIGKDVLDIACGEGYGTFLLSSNASEVIGVDISQECIEHASKRYAQLSEKIRFIEGAMQAIPLADESVDVVVSFESLEHISSDDQTRFIREVGRVLRPGGLLFVSTPNTAIYGEEIPEANPFHSHEVDIVEFKSLLQSEFPFLRIYEQGFEVVSVVIDRAKLSNKTVPICSWRNEAHIPDGKYLLAVASKQALRDIDIASVVLDTGKNFHEISRKYWMANLELEKVGKWAQSLDRLREQQESEIAMLHNKLTALDGTHLKGEALADISNREFDILLRHISDLRADLGKIVSRDSHSTQVIAQQARIINSLESRNRELLLQLDQLTLESQARERMMVTVEEAEAQLLQREVILREEMNKTTAKLEATEIALAKAQKNVEILNRANIIAYERTEFFRDKYEAARKLEDVLKREAKDAENDAAFSRRALKEVEDELQRIYESDGWRLLKRYYKLKGKYLNEGSWQYRFIKRLMKGKAITPATKGSLKTETTTGAINILEFSVEPNSISIPIFETIDVSIVIPAFNAFEMNLKCIKAVVENTKGVAYEVILADDASTDRTREIEIYVENLVLSRTEGNQGFIKNCNKAAAIAKGKYVHFLNNDTEVTDGWLRSLVAVMNSDEKVGMVGSMLIYPDGRLQEAGGIIWKDASGWNYGNRTDKESPEFNYVKEVDYVSGASILIRMDLWRKLGGFDEQFSPAYCEDSDLAFQIRQAGYKVMYQPESRVIHYEGYSHGTDTEGGTVGNVKTYQVANGKKFFSKWRQVLESEHFENGQHVFWARDRSRYKKAILFIDHYVPHFDKDAGSKTTLHYLKLFLKLGYNIKFIGDNFYRHEPYTTTLQQMGIEVLYGPIYANNWQGWLKEHADKFEFAYLNRPHISIKYIDFLKENIRARIIYYGHDLHFLREQRRFQLEGDDVHLKESRKWKQIEANLFSKADLSLTPSLEEFKTIRAEFPESNVQVMRPYIFDARQAERSEFGETSDILFVGGFNHQPNVDAVWWFVKDIWPIISARVTDARFIIVGSNPPVELKAIVNERIVLEGFVSDEQLRRLYSSARVVVVPLRYGAGVKGKTVEAMYHGVPIATTTNGVEGLPGAVDFLKPLDMEAAFADEVIRLYQDEGYWEFMSQSGFEYVKQEFSEEKAIEILQNALATIKWKADS